MNLFVCGTIFQLIKAINIRVTMLESADLILTDTADFTTLEPGIKKWGIFREIYTMKDDEYKKQYWQLLGRQKRSLSRHPEKGIDPIVLNCEYQDLYLPSLSAYNKLFYYYLIQQGMKPEIHLYEEGITTYVIDILENMKKDGMSHAYYGRNSIVHHLEEILLYEPDLYSCDSFTDKIHSLPKLEEDRKELIQRYLELFKTCKLPQHKYIFLEEAFMKDGILSSDVELVDEIAKQVGKENIVIKPHPRNQVQRFEKRGYAIFPSTTIPWEIVLMSNSLQDKVLLTVSSTSSITAKQVMNKSMNAIQLFDLMYLGKAQHVRQKAFENYYKKLTGVLNREQRCVYSPKSMEELSAIIRYLRYTMNT